MKKIILTLSICFLSINLQSQVFEQNNSGLGLGLSAISVTVGGQFPVTGTFNALITERVDQFVTRLYNEAADKMLRSTNDPIQLKQIKKDLEYFSLRGITLKRTNGEQYKLDLLQFRITGDFSENPYLKNDDLLIFPPYNMGTNFFTVSGAVNEQGRFFYMEGDRVSDALLLARGLNEAYENIDTYEIHRLNYEGTQIEKFEYDISEDVKLQRGDRIVFVAEETQRRDFAAYVVGEVNKPGSVPLPKYGLTLREVVEQAGGFTDEASLKRARVVTNKNILPLLKYYYGFDIQYKMQLGDPDVIDELVNVEDLMMLRMSNLLVEDTAYFQIENELRVLTEGSAVDFTELNNPASDAANYVVQNGDIVIVPQRRDAVYVFGQVANPGYVNFVDGRDYKFYLNKVGGVGEYAEEEIMIIKGSSRNWIHATEETLIESGDYIFVPKERLRSFRSYAQEYGTYIGIVGSIATIILLLVQLGK